MPKISTYIPEHPELYDPEAEDRRYDLIMHLAKKKLQKNINHKNHRISLRHPATEDMVYVTCHPCNETVTITGIEIVTAETRLQNG